MVKFKFDAVAQPFLARLSNLDEYARGGKREFMQRQSFVKCRPRAAVVALIAFVLCNMGGAAIAKDWPRIRFASEGARPPYNYLNGDSQLDGFEIDLAREICTRLKAECSFVAQDWESLIPGLLAGQYDAVIAALEINDRRREKIAFSEPYLHMPSSFVSARRRQIRDESPDGLAGRTIGVAADTPQHAYLEELYTKSTIKTYDGIEAAMLDLAEGRIDVMFGEKDAVTDFLKNRYEAKCCKLLADAPRDPAYFGEGIGIGLRKEDLALRAAFDKAIDEVMADGTFAKIRAKYFEFEVN
jgi:polar amino acid transport system substrate-binding protein